MVKCSDVLDSLCIYQTPKLVTIHSKIVGVVSRLVQLLVLSYVIGYVIVYRKGYQDFSDVQSSVTTKVKGIAYTDFANNEFCNYVKDKDLYRRIWDVADYVVPPSENGAVFVATNVVITNNQSLTTCAEDTTILGAPCDPDNNSCEKGQMLPIGNGILTGKCINTTRIENCESTVENQTHSCEIKAWCPVEDDRVPLKYKRALLEQSENFTILIKNFVDFPKFKDARRRNIKDTSNRTYLESCRYDQTNNFDCPVFRLGDIIKWAGYDYSDLAYKGAVVAIIINWDCNFDRDKKYCFPTYSFSRLDDPEAKLAPGWNFRYSNVYGDDSRTLYKLFGIKFSIIVQGQAGKFTVIPLLLNVGAGLGLLALEVVVCDIVILYFEKKKSYYKSKKYEDTMHEGEKDEFVVVAPQVVVSPTPSGTPKLYGEGGYERLTD